ncbi:hypothetical protein AQF52_3453 [Streptomyces venezuelae]|nr:hypothetical protein AQF52_3453 [Streptomyces venezuelae]
MNAMNENLDNELELWSESLDLEVLQDAVSPGFTTAFCGACAGSASCPVGCVGSMSSVSSQGG